MIVKLAWKNNWRNPVRSLIVLLSVAMSVFAGIFILALYQGMMDSRTRNVINHETGHLQIHHKKYKEEEWLPALPRVDVLDTVLRNSSLVSAYALRSVLNGMASTPTGSNGIQLVGIEPEGEYGTTGTNQTIIEGKPLTSQDEHHVMIGKRLADKLGVHTGQKMVLTFADSAGNLMSSAFRIKGIYQTENAIRDAFRVYVLRKTISYQLQTPDLVQEVSIVMSNPDSLLVLAHRLSLLTGDHLVETWMETSPETYLMISFVDRYSYVVMTVLLLAIAFGIMNTMMMSVLERSGEIGMLRAVGMPVRVLVSMISLETLFLTVLGVPVGLCLSWILILLLQHTGIDFSKTGAEMMASFGFESRLFPVYPLSKIPGILLLIFLTSLFSALLPVWKSVQLNTLRSLQE